MNLIPAYIMVAIPHNLLISEFYFYQLLDIR